jgi:hypothetical protein
MDRIIHIKPYREPWNKGKLVDQKAPLKLKDICAIRVRLQISRPGPAILLYSISLSTVSFESAISLSFEYGTSPTARVCPHERLSCSRTPSAPVQFEITEVTGDAVASWINRAGLRSEQFFFPAAFMPRRICPQDNTHGSSTHG